MKKKKALAAIVAVALICCIAAGASLAYLQDKTTVAENTFTLGKVDIKLDETKLDDKGEPTDERTEEGNDNYHLLPGQTVTKDPVVTVLANSEECYVRAFVTLDHAKEFLEVYRAHGMSIAKALEFFGGISEDWTAQNLGMAAYDEAKNTITVEFRYNETVKTSEEDQRLDAIVDTVTLPSWVNNTDTEKVPDGFTVTVYAEAIQAKGFDDADAAWAEFDSTVDPYVVPTSTTTDP